MRTDTGKRIVTYGSVAAAITAMIVLANQLGYELPRFARTVEVEALHNEQAGEISSSHDLLLAGMKENAANILVIQLNANQGLIYRNQAEQDRLKRRDKVDENLQREAIYLRNERDRLQRELKDLEGN